jgi:hypothetical protein
MAKKDGENDMLTSDYFIHADPSNFIYSHCLLIWSLFSHEITINYMKVNTIRHIPNNIL